MDGLNTVMEIILKGVIALSGIFMAYILIAFYFPRFIMKPTFAGKKISDRGLKKYVYEDGRGIVYEPEICARKYVKQYMLFTRDGSKYLKCYVNDKINHLSYDILVFNNRNKLIDVVTVSEQLKSSQTTSSVPLVAETSYVSLVVRKVDNMYVDRRVMVKYSDVSCAICGVLSALCIAISGVLLNSFLSALFANSDIEFLSGIGAFVKFLFVGLAWGAAIALLYRFKYRKEMN